MGSAIWIELNSKRIAAKTWRHRKLNIPLRENTWQAQHSKQPVHRNPSADNKHRCLMIQRNHNKRYAKEILYILLHR